MTRITKLILCLALLGASTLCNSAAPSTRAQQKQQLESERASLQRKLDALKRDIYQTETDKGSAADALTKSEVAISNANRALRELSAEQNDTQTKLTDLNKEQRDLHASTKTEQSHLSKLLREQYIISIEDRIKLLLSGENPNNITRDLEYMAYASRAKAKLIDSLQTHLKAIEDNKLATENAKTALDEIVQEQREQKVILEKEKRQRDTQLSRLSNKLAEQRKEVGRLERDEERLTNLVTKLSKLVTPPKKNKANDKEKSTDQQLSRAEKKDDKSEKIKPSDNDSSTFAQLRGRLRLPTPGEVLIKFGVKRNDGPDSKGLFIRANQGAEVKSVANGRVIFADWLRGFGNLIIIDHGDKYLSIYGNNQTLFKHPGDYVSLGDIIADVGNSGGNEQPGLYFEMRHQGLAFNPLNWITTR